MNAAAYPLTHPDKVLHTQQGITKRDLLTYYELVADRMLPHVKNRPLTLVRCLNGAEQPDFFQKHPGRGLRPELQTMVVAERHGSAPHGVIANRAGLFALVQYSSLEIHTWGSRIYDLDHPDVLVLDLDPDPTIPYELVVDAAHDVRRWLAERGLESFAKTTGGKGFHVCVPLVPERSWDEVHAVAQHAAEDMAEMYPDRYVATPSKSARRGKIFIDYLRNFRGATFVAPYSTRAKKDAPISMPLHWDQVSPDIRPETFTVRTILERLGMPSSDPFMDFEGHAQRLARELIPRGV